MKNFNWEEFKKGNIAVHCDTEEKAKDFLEKCDTKGIKFKVRNRTTEGTNSWKWYEEQTIYCINNNKLLYSSYLERRAIGYKIIEWEIDTMKELKFTEVIANIKEGQVWECTRENARLKTINIKKGSINFIYKDGLGMEVFGVKETDTFILQRKEYTFQEAFKAYEEGKEIESMKFKYKKIEDEDKFYSKNNQWWFNNDGGFEPVEIRGKWYIND